MLENRYGLKYSMPHSVVHIIDNSLRAGEMPSVVVDDPSLYATIVVSGAPMGTDNEMISINDSSILNVAYGMNSLSSGDVKKYGQTVTYPAALLSQNVPVKFMRVTPPDATYAFSCLLIQWRWDGSTMHVRFKTTSGNGNNGLPLGMVHSSFKNPARLNSALVRGFTNDSEPDNDGGSWKQRVFMTAIAAGRGKVYNYFNYSINQTQQSKRPANVRYQFSTIDTRTNQTVERFFASLINQNNGNKANPIDTVNVLIGKRVKGSSIIIPTINEAAVKELYNEYMARMNEMIEADILPITSDSMKWVKEVVTTLDQNTFDPIYGRYIYNGDTDVKLPYFQVDMFDLDIPQLDTANRLKVFLDSGTEETPTKYLANPTDLHTVLEEKTYGITNPKDSYHIGDLFITNTATLGLSMITSINQFTGAVTSIPISQVYTDDTVDENPPKTDTKGNKDMFRAFVSVSDATVEKIDAAVKELISRKKLVPRVSGTTTNSDKEEYTYTPDFVLVENRGSVNSINKLNNFVIAKITYQNKEVNTPGDPTIEKSDNGESNGKGTQIYDTPEKIYTRLVYPSTKVTSFAISESDEFYSIPGTTFIDLTGTESVSDGNKKGVVYVNGYNYPTDKKRYTVASAEKPFFVGPCPTSIAVTENVMNVSYDVMVYKNSVTGSGTNISWTVVGGSASGDTCTGYEKGDVITIKKNGSDDTSLKGTQFTITDVENIVNPLDNANVVDQRITVKLTASSSSTTKIDPGVYDTENITATEESANDNRTSPEGLKIVLTAADIKIDLNPPETNPAMIRRFTVAGTQGSIYRYGMDTTDIPADYYSPAYGINPNSELGGISLENGYAGFFDDDISEIEFKWKYSELLVKAYKGQIDPRITSPTRCPAKYLFDGGTNTIVGQTILPYMVYKPIDIINASTIYTDDEKEAILLNNGLISSITDYVDIDVKQAMYDLMVYRCYQGIPEDKRPIGPGSGMSLHLDSGITDANTAMLINTSFTKRFSNPNASWDIGGYVSSADGISYTYAKALVDNMFAHMKRYTVNKPFTGKYTNIAPNQYTSFFPDVDTTDWEYRELLYNSGGNAWIMDVNGNLQRRSQRTLYREGDTSDLIQENNMRTLSQLVYLLQNKIDSYLLEYNDDGVLKTLKDDVDNMFSNWVGNYVQALDITFQRDINPLDGGEIVVCYCNVTFRGLILRVPIIVNVQRRTDSE